METFIIIIGSIVFGYSFSLFIGVCFDITNIRKELKNINETLLKRNQYL